MTTENTAVSAEDFASQLAQAAANDQPETESQNEAPEQEQTEGVEPEAVEPEEGDEAEGEADQPEAESAESFIEYEVEGEKRKASVEEAAKVLREQELMKADYTRKTQQLAEQRKAAEAEAMQRLQFVEQHAGAIGDLQATVQRIREYEKVDWATLRETDPNSYVLHMTELNNLKGRANEITNFVQSKRQEFDAQSQSKYAKVWEQIHEAAPEFTVEKLGQIVQGAQKKYGADPRALANLDDAKSVLMLAELWKKAEAFDALQDKKPAVAKKVAALPKVTKAATNAAPPSRVDQALKRASTARSANDFASAFSAALKGR